MSYSGSSNDVYRRAANRVDRILKGANPAELPIEQPTKFELVINLNTAKDRRHDSAERAGASRQGNQIDGNE